MKSLRIFGTACFLVVLQIACASAGIMFTINQQEGSADLETIVTVMQLDSNSLKFTLTVNDDNTGNIGDLRAIYFDVADENLLGGLSVLSGSEVTDSDFDANGVQNLGGGSTINPLGPFDAGVEIGGPGIGMGDDFQTTMFVLEHSASALDVNSFFRVGGTAGDYVVAIRGTSVGPEFGSRDGSSKTGNGSPPIRIPPNLIPNPNVPEPGSAVIWMAAMSLCVFRRRKVR